MSRRIILLTPRRRFLANRYGLGYQVPLGLVFLGGPLADAGHVVRLIDNDLYGWDAPRLVAPGGVYVANVIDNPAYGEFMRAYARTLNTVFPNVAVLTGQSSAELRGLATYVVAASPQPLDAARLDHPAERVRVVPADRVAEWLAAGRNLVLTDDYVPVDNLMAPMFAERGY